LYHNSFTFETENFSRGNVIHHGFAVDNPADYDKMFAATDSGVGKALVFPVKRETGEMPVRTRHCMQRLLSLGGELRPLETGRRQSTML
jgi:hypothetical protein